MLKLIAFSKKRLQDIESTSMDDRKKSHNMVFAITAVQEICETHKDITEFDMIFCTGEGEIGQTFEFYKNMANGERARPLVFQNSLHNSTLGALSLAISKASSGITVSNGDLSCEMSLDMALTSKSSRPLLIIGTDVYNDKILEIRENYYKGKVDLVSGACAALFLPETSPLFKTHSGPVLADINITKLKESHSEHFSSYYPANGLEAICEKLQTSLSFTINRPKNYQVKISAQAL